MILGLGCDHIHPLYIEKQPISELLWSISSKTPSCFSLHTSRTKDLPPF